MKNKKITIISLAAITALLVSACQAAQPEEEQLQYDAVFESGLIAEGTFEPHPSVQLAFSMSGTVSQVFIEEGKAVKQGDPIARLSACGPIQADLAATSVDLLNNQQELSDLELYADIARAEALQVLINAQEAFDEAQNDWDDYDDDAYQDDLGEEQEDVRDAQQDLDDAIADLQEYLDLEQDNPTRERYQDAVDDAESDLHLQQQDLNEVENDYRQAQHDYDLAAGQLSAAQAEYDRKIEGPDTDQLTLLQSRIAALESAIAGLEEHRAACQISAPISGTLLYNDLQVGEFVTAGDPVLMVADTSQWQLKTDDISEYEVVSIQTGQEVEVTVDALPGEIMAGTVESIDQVATLVHGDVTYTVTITVQDAPPELRWGMTAAIRLLPAN
jgi:multidrug resistance efflux pump